MGEWCVCLQQRTLLSQGFDEGNFALAQLLVNFLSERLAGSQVLIQLGDEKEVTGTGLDSGGAREEQVGEGVADDADAEFVAGSLFAAVADDIEHLAAVLLGVV